MEIMAEDWVRLQLGMRLQIGVLRYFISIQIGNHILLSSKKLSQTIGLFLQNMVLCTIRNFETSVLWYFAYSTYDMVFTIGVLTEETFRQKLGSSVTILVLFCILV